jgi:hypothetical protein
MQTRKRNTPAAPTRRPPVYRLGSWRVDLKPPATAFPLFPSGDQKTGVNDLVVSILLTPHVALQVLR